MLVALLTLISLPSLKRAGSASSITDGGVTGGGTLQRGCSVQRAGGGRRVYKMSHISVI